MIPVNINVETKYIAAAFAALCFAGALIALGYGLADKDPSVICRTHIDRALVLKEQVKTLETTAASVKHDALISCAKRENKLCLDKIREVSERMRALRCKICTARGTQ